MQHRYLLSQNPEGWETAGLPPCDAGGADVVVEHEVREDKEGGELAESEVGVQVRRAEGGEAGRQLSVAQRVQGGGESSQQEAERHRCDE